MVIIWFDLKLFFLNISVLSLGGSVDNILGHIFTFLVIPWLQPLQVLAYYIESHRAVLGNRKPIIAYYSYYVSIHSVISSDVRAVGHLFQVPITCHVNLENIGTAPSSSLFHQRSALSRWQTIGKWCKFVKVHQIWNWPQEIGQIYLTAVHKSSDHSHSIESDHKLWSFKILVWPCWGIFWEVAFKLELSRMTHNWHNMQYNKSSCYRSTVHKCAKATLPNDSCDHWPYLCNWFIYISALFFFHSLCDDMECCSGSSSAVLCPQKFLLLSLLFMWL